MQQEEEDRAKLTEVVVTVTIVFKEWTAKLRILELRIHLL
jgi:hypothetical protein